MVGNDNMSSEKVRTAIPESVGGGERRAVGGVKDRRESRFT